MLYRIKWSIVEKGYGKIKIDFFLICLAEKGHLIKHFNDNRLLNNKKEFIRRCRHQVKMLLKSSKRK